MPLLDNISYSLVLQLLVSCIEQKCAFSPCCTHTYVLSKTTHSKSPKMKNRDCNVLDVILSLRREEIHQRSGNGTTMKTQETQKAVLQSCISGVKLQLGKHLGSILLRSACIAGQTSLIFLFHTDKSTTYKKTEIKSPNIPKYIQGEIANDIYSHLWHIPCTFSMDKLGTELWWNAGMKYKIVEIKQKKGWMFLHLGVLVIPKKNAGLKQCPRAVVLICSQSTSSWVIDSSLACPLHMPVTWHTSHHSRLSHWLLVLMQSTRTSRQEHRVL